MQKIFVFSCLAILLCAQHLVAQDTASARIDSIISQKMKENGIVGVGAAIIINRIPVWKKGYGFADKENRIPFTTATVMNIASVTKTMTGACIMKAVEQGKLSLDEDINNYLPFKIHNPYCPDERITLRNLATHTSGLSDRYPFYTDSVYFNDKDSPEALGDFLRNYYVPGGKHYSKENFLDHKPGRFREYSNIATALAGYIVEERTGKKLDEYSRQYILRPLKMKHTSWFLADINPGDHTKLYAKQDDGTIHQIPFYGLTTYPDGGVHTNVEDLTSFFICLLNDGKFNHKQVLSKAAAQEMLRFQFNDGDKPENVNPAQLNSGIFWATKMGGKRIGHNGSDPGVRTFMLSDLERKIAVILFFNTSLTEKEEAVFFDIYSELYKYGIKIRDSAPKKGKS